MCKKRLKIRLCVNGKCRNVLVELHPAGCMGASRTHIDIPEESLPRGIVEAAARRGYRFNWRMERGCLTLEDPYGALPAITLCGSIPRPRATPLLRRLRKGKVYLGL